MLANLLVYSFSQYYLKILLSKVISNVPNFTSDSSILSYISLILGQSR